MKNKYGRLAFMGKAGEGGWSKYIRALYLTMLQALKERQT